MGTWLGHAAPGTFFILFSLWWLVRSLHNYFSKPSRYTNSTIRFCCCKSGCFSRLPLDNWVLMFVAGLGVFMEIVTSMVASGEVVMGNQQHLTMYIAFGLVGLISVLVHHKIAFVPKGAEYMVLLMAFIIELILFAFHLHGRDPVDVHIHMLLVYSIGGCIIATLAEFHYPHSINASLARNYTVLLQGSWFYQIAFTLYPPNGIPTWDLNEMENIMLITLVFSWHMIGCLMVLLIVSGLTYWCCSFQCRGDYDGELSVKLLPVGKQVNSTVINGYSSVASDDETELFSSPLQDPSNQ